MTDKPIRILSLGAGMQSTTIAEMISRGDLPPVAAAIFADTGWEPKAVYQHLDQLSRRMPFPIYRVSRGNLRDDLIGIYILDSPNRNT